MRRVALSHHSEGVAVTSALLVIDKIKKTVTGEKSNKCFFTSHQSWTGTLGLHPSQLRYTEGLRVQSPSVRAAEDVGGHRKRHRDGLVSPAL
eukprot:g35937.t1